MNFIVLGNILRESRKKAGYTQQEVADLFNMTFSNVSSWERGKSKIDIESYLRLCNFYGIEAIEPLIEATKGMKEYYIALPDDVTSGDEAELIGKYKDLNKGGKIKSHDYIDDLLESERYVDDKSIIKYWREKRDGEIMNNNTMANFLETNKTISDETTPEGQNLETVDVFKAARSNNNAKPQIVKISAERIKKLDEAPETDEI